MRNLRTGFFTALAFTVVTSTVTSTPTLLQAQTSPSATTAETRTTPSDSDPLAQMSIEQLTNLVVTSPSKKEEKYSNVSAALFVITADDIKRSGKTSIPEILRMVPGLTVARIDNGQWAISSRGFTSIFADKLLVLMDGRSVYTPLYSGVFWNEVDSMLEDIDRIEVIRGPGATLYGANAVNGVINIITKSAKNTKGGYVSAGGGTSEKEFFDGRYGGSFGDTDYRVYAKYFNRDENKFDKKDSQLGKAHDNWEGVRSGVRTDTKISRRDNLMVQAEGYYGEVGIDFIDSPPPSRIARPETRYIDGANLVSRYTHKISDTSDLALQLYYDHIDRDDVTLRQNRDTWDMDFQHRFGLGESHDIVYGAGYRVYQDSYDGSFALDVVPDQRTLNLYTGFVQDEITLIPQLLKLTGGTKLEYNDLSGLEVLPNARAVLTPDETNTVWAAFSRAVRSPGRFNQDGRLLLQEQRLPNGALAAGILTGDSSYNSEYLYAYEAGYRTQPLKNLSFDLSVFYNDYHDLESVEPNGSPFFTSYRGQQYVEVPFRTDNLLKGYTYGAELAVDWRPLNFWRLVGTYSYIDLNLSRKDGSQDTVFLGAEDRTPTISS